MFVHDKLLHYWIHSPIIRIIEYFVQYKMMFHRTSPHPTDFDSPDAHRLALRVRGLPRKALAELPGLATADSLSTVAVAVISALAWVASGSGG
jgi:hypothetical protein